MLLRAADLGVGAGEVGSHRQDGLRFQGGTGQVGCSKFGNNVNSCWPRKDSMVTAADHPSTSRPHATHMTAFLFLVPKDRLVLVSTNVILSSFRKFGESWSWSCGYRVEL